MPVDRQHNRFVFECDSCEETFEGEYGEEFRHVACRAQHAGWKFKKIGDQWVRGCERCGV